MQKDVKMLKTLFSHGRLSESGSQVKIHVQTLSKSDIAKLNTLANAGEVEDINVKRSGTGMTIILD